MGKLAVSETFYSLQGEGSTMGRPSVFLRLAGCNLLCGGIGTDKDKKLHNGATWRCDTIEVWQKGLTKDFRDVLSASLIERLIDGAHLIITGGEPLLQQSRIVEYLTWLEDYHNVAPFIEIETNGTIVPSDSLCLLVDQWNVSPKLQNSGESYERCINNIALLTLSRTTNSIFKFVITDHMDWVQVGHIIDIAGVPRDRVWLMPGCSDIGTLLKNNQLVSNISLVEGVNYSSRLQIEIWDKTVGV